MADKSININHSTSGFLSNDGTYIQVGENSAVKIGFGSNISNGAIDNFNTNVLEKYAGSIRINKSTVKLEYCNGTTWVEFLTSTEDNDTSTIYSFIF